MSSRQVHRLAATIKHCDPARCDPSWQRRESLLKTATLESRHSMPCAWAPPAGPGTASTLLAPMLLCSRSPLWVQTGCGRERYGSRVLKKCVFFFPPMLLLANFSLMFGSYVAFRNQKAQKGSPAHHKHRRTDNQHKAEFLTYKWAPTGTRQTFQDGK